ncbi:hypothetical protein ASZ90_019694 [hydrocarbon metagenome]|uniref:Uncharacterized protein n=1 Tax=hydrocarbon metagenome TaxID=938273 RepID=A0A0W8E3E6_9ZZZZ
MPRASFCGACGAAVVNEADGSRQDVKQPAADQFEEKKKLTWGNFLKQILGDTGKSFLKSLPLSILFFLISLAVHTYLLVGVNQGFSPDTVMGREILASSGNVFSATLLWTVISTLFFSAIIFIKRKGITALIKGLIITPKQIIHYIKDNSAAAPVALLTGAGLALLIAGVTSKTTSLTLAAGASVLFATPVGRLAAILIRNFWNGIWELFGVKRRKIRSYILIEAYLNMAGTACAFVLAILIPWDSFIGIILLGAAAAIMLSNRGEGRSPAMPLFLFCAALVYFIGDGLSTLEGYHLLADDGGEAEAGGWANWLGSQGSYQAVANGMLPALGASFGPALAAALNAVDPGLYDVDLGDDQRDDTDWQQDQDYRDDYEGGQETEGGDQDAYIEGEDQTQTDTDNDRKQPSEEPPEYDQDGYDQYGFDKEGYDRNGLDREGFNRNGFDSDGYDRSGYDKDGYDRDGRHRDGYDSEGYDKNGFNEQGYDKDGYDRDGFDLYGYDRNGYNEWGYNRSGYDKDGNDREGFDQYGYDKQGFDPSGYNKDGYDKNGFNRDGFNSGGYDKNGFDKDGWNKDGRDKDGYDKTGYDKEGYDRYGFNRGGLNREGLNIFGETKEEAFARIRRDQQHFQDDAFVERWGERVLWLLEKGPKFLADKSIDVLEKLTGPPGYAIKKAYLLACGLGEGLGEGLIDGNYSQHLWDGAVKGGKDVLLDIATGQIFDYLGGKLEDIGKSVPGFLDFTPFNPKDPAWGQARVKFVMDALLGQGGDPAVRDMVKDRVLTGVKHMAQNHLQTEATREVTNFALDQSGIDKYTGRF